MNKEAFSGHKNIVMHFQFRLNPSFMYSEIWYVGEREPWMDLHIRSSWSVLSKEGGMKSEREVTDSTDRTRYPLM